MNSLKRTLSLVLVLVMVLGLVGVAGAAYTDEAQIQYKEAVGVMTGIGAIEGDAGAFNPAGTITRAQAAKMVAYTILSKDVAKLLPVKVSSFKDVNANFAWAIPSIEYLVSKGIIEGYNKDTFGPNDPVTANQLAKMLLCAAGYGKKGEFSDSSWELNTAVLASGKGIYTGTKATDFSKAATREEAALYCFNALNKVNQVVWSKDKETYVTADKGTIGTEVYTLRSVASQVDALGRPARKWYAGTSTTPIATASSTPILTYTAGVTMKELKLAIANAGYKFATSGDFSVVRNGGTAQTFNVSNPTFADSYVVGGNGVVTEVYGDSTTNEVTTLVYVITYLGQVTNITKDVAATTTVDESALTITYMGLGSNPTPITVTASAVAKTPGFAAAYAAANAYLAAKGEHVKLLVIPNGDNPSAKVALSVAVPTPKTIKASSFVANTSFVADGTTYKYSSTFTGNKIAGFTSYDIALDSYGYVIAAAGTATSANYAYVADLGATSDGFTTTYIGKLVYADGTTATVKLDKNYTEAFFSKATAKGELVTYATNAAGQVALTPATATTKVGNGALSINRGSASFTLDGTPELANAKTVFVVGTTAANGITTYKSYVGIAAVPSYSKDSSANCAVIYDANFAAMVYLDNPTATGTTTTDKVFVSHVAQAPVTIPDGNGGSVTYYLANAVVNGEVKTIKLASDYAIGVYTSITYSNEIASLGGLLPTSGSNVVTGNAFTGKAVTAAINGVISIDAKYYGYTSDCAVYFYDATTGALTAATVGLIPSATTNGYYVANASGVITAIYLAK